MKHAFTAAILITLCTKNMKSHHLVLLLTLNCNLKLFLVFHFVQSLRYREIMYS